MPTQLDKVKRADKTLMHLMAGCIFLGLWFIGTVLCFYLTHGFSNLWDKELPSDVYKPIIKGYLVCLWLILPSAGVVFLTVGYGIWNYRRKRGPIKDDDNNDAAQIANGDTRKSRPNAVKFAIIFMLIGFSWAIGRDMVDVQGNNLSAYIGIGIRLIIVLILFWFIFLGRNWARWLWAVLALAGLCLEISWIVQHNRTLSTTWIIEFSIHSLIYLFAFIALFKPSSNAWFRGYSSVT
jgi:heme/copper-type cytochrome/quinol oxidase subunit 2